MDASIPRLNPRREPRVAYETVRSESPVHERERSKAIAEETAAQPLRQKTRQRQRVTADFDVQGRTVVKQRPLSSPRSHEERSPVERRVEPKPTESRVKMARSSEERLPTPETKRSPGRNGPAWPVRAKPDFVRDDRWLAEALTNKYQQFKRYPFMAKRNGWEGNVVLAAVIKSDGNLEGLSVADSSGHQILDEDAVETMRRVFPLDLEHPLGRSQIAIQLTIRYRLNHDD